MTAGNTRIIVIGGVAAGMSAASKARRTNPQAEILVFERGDWVSYSACGLPYFVGGLVAEKEALIARSVAEFANQRIDVRLRNSVSEIKPDQHVVVGQTAEDLPFEQPYDELLIATGARPTLPSIEGLDLEGIFSLYTMNDALAMREYIATAKPKRAVIVGGGYIGLEMAENLDRLGIKLAVVQRPPQLFSTVDAEIGELVFSEVERHDIDVSLCESIVRACTGANGRVACVETTQGSIDADMVLLATGIQANVDLARDAGVTIGVTGAIAVDEQQRTNLPNIYAAGDCAEHFHLVTNTPFWAPLGTTANKQGRVAGENMAGGKARFRGIVGTAITRAFDLQIGRTGISETEAKNLRRDVVATTVDYTDVAGYYPGAVLIRVKLVAERGTGRLLGGQAAGYGGVDKRIDVLATALHANMAVDELSALDLGYAPPFNSVWDPILVAAGQLAKQV